MYYICINLTLATSCKLLDFYICYNVTSFKEKPDHLLLLAMDNEHHGMKNKKIFFGPICNKKIKRLEFSHCRLRIGE